MSIEKMREEFKHWESEADDGPQTDPMWLMFDLDLNQFALVEIQSRWEAWQASREALVIELPEKDPAGSGGGDCGDGRPSEEQYVAAHCNIVLAQCRKAIEAAGLKVKS